MRETPPTMIDDCLAVVLAGGDSRRMGRDKTALRLGERTLLERAARALQAIFPQVLVSVRTPCPDFPWPQIGDRHPGAGPLAGLLVALENARAAKIPWVFALAADMPFVQPELIAHLAKKRDAGEAVVPVAGGHPQPLAAFYATGCLPAIGALLDAEAALGVRRSLRAALAYLNVCYVGEQELLAIDPGLRSFIDLDTPQEFAVADAWLKEVSKRNRGESRGTGQGPAETLEWRPHHRSSTQEVLLMENLTVKEAQACILEHARPSGVEELMLERALGRVLAEEIRANRDQPPYDVSAMDGFAARSADLTNAPAVLAVIEDIRAGDKPQRTVGLGQCARIMTGAPLPPGADTVIRVEDSRARPDGRVEITASPPPGKDIRRRGEALRDGETVLAPGAEITPGVIGVLATVKRARLKVYRQPTVAILATGNELEAMDEPFDPDKIPDSNSYALQAQLRAFGLEAVRLGIARDDLEELSACLRRGLEYDVLLVSGGSSVGVHDHVRPALEALGVAVRFWRVAMRPGHPLVFGTSARGSLVFGLPGNPVSSMVCGEQFVLPALRRMTGHVRLFRRTVEARLAQPVKIHPGRSEFVRVRLQRDPAGHLVATSTGTQSSGVLRSMAAADGLLIVPAASSGFAAGETATVQLLDGTAYQEAAGFAG